MQAQSISLAGEWNVELGKSKSAFSPRANVWFADAAKRAILPGTIDTNHLGFAPKDTMETTHLTRLYAYKGAARYSRTINIPKDWKKKPVELFLERTRPTWVYVDGELVDSCNFISTPQRYLLSKKVKPGKHLLEIVVDNGRGVPDQVYGSSHAYTEDTQTNWNGIIGEITPASLFYRLKSEETLAEETTFGVWLEQSLANLLFVLPPFRCLISPRISISKAPTFTPMAIGYSFVASTMRLYGR